MFQQRVPARHHRCRGNTLLGTQDRPLAVGRYRLSAKAESGNPCFPLPFAAQTTIHREREPYVVCPITAAYRSLAEDNPQQPQSIGDRDVRTYTWHHGKYGYRHFLFLLQRHSHVVGKLICQGGEAPSEESIAGVLETDTCPQHPHIYHLPSGLQSGMPLLPTSQDRKVLHRDKGFFRNTMIILMKWWISI